MDWLTYSFSGRYACQKKLDYRNGVAENSDMNNKLKIAVLDGFTTVGHDLNWDAFKQYADIVVFDRTPKEKIIERASDADAVFTNKVPLFKEQLDALPKLRYIGVLATGYNNVDVRLAAERGIVVTNIPQYGTDSVAQAVFAHILNISNRVAVHAEAVRSGVWCKSADVCFRLTEQVELAGKTLGIIGFGAIGRKVARIAEAFSMNVLAFAPSREIGEFYGAARICPVDEIFASSDIVSLNCPLNEKTAKIITAQSLSKFKRGAWLINPGRGGLIDENALADALNSGRVAFAGLDVLSVEPPAGGNPLLGLSNCFITPHNAWTTTEARRRLLGICLENFKAWCSASPINTVF